MKAIQTALVAANTRLCKDHLRLTLCVPEFDEAQPGQFVHLCPARNETLADGTHEPHGNESSTWNPFGLNPLLRRAFSIAGLVRRSDSVFLDVIHRVVGAATRWMETLSAGAEISVLGPLGNRFPIDDRKSRAWLIAGGVGLPPMLWLAQALCESGKSSVAFCGAQRAELLALTISSNAQPAPDARQASPSAVEFARSGVPVIISTDDGSLGFHGNVGQALAAYAEANPPNAEELIAYTCGPERMMRFVAEFCRRRGIQCYVCVERNMACGLGTCQSCAVPVVNHGDAQGWSYRLCCTDGPVFDATSILWDTPRTSAPPAAT